MRVDNIDVFCEKGVFSCDQSRRILEAGRERGGWKMNFHGDELNPIGGAEVGCNLSVSCDSCNCVKNISKVELSLQVGVKVVK